jgi:hypothetical protein
MIHTAPPAIITTHNQPKCLTWANAPVTTANAIVAPTARDSVELRLRIRQVQCCFHLDTSLIRTSLAAPRALISCSRFVVTLLSPFSSSKFIFEERGSSDEFCLGCIIRPPDDEELERNPEE